MNSQKKSVHEYQLPSRSIGRLDLDKKIDTAAPEEAIKAHAELLQGELKWTDSLNCSETSRSQLA